MPRAARIRYELLVALSVAAIFTALTALGQTSFLYGYDYVRMHAFNRSFLRETVLSGSFPWWNPHIALGRPFAADIEAAVFYPPTWLVLPFGTTAGVVIAVYLHATLAVMGAFRCARRLGVEHRTAAWTAAAALLFGGPLYARHMTGQLDVVFALCWLPLVFERVIALQDRPSRGGIATGAIVYALFLLAGSPPMVWIGTLAAITLVLARATTLRSAATGLGTTAAMAGIGACIAGTILVPFAELVLEGNRPIQASAAALALPMTNRGWESLVMPPTAGFGVNQEFDLYVGLPLVIAAVCGIRWIRNPNVRGMLVTAGVFALLASAPFGPIRAVLVEHVPGMASLRVPARYAIVGSWMIALLGAFTLSRIQHRRLLFGSLVALEAAALLFGAWRSNRLLHQDESFPGERNLVAAVQPWRNDKAPVRVAYSWFHVRPNFAMAADVSTFQSFANPVLARVWDYIHVVRNQPVPQLDLVTLYPQVTGADPFPFDAMNLRAGEVNLSGSFVSRTDVDPRAYVADRSRRAATWREALALVAKDRSQTAASPIVENDSDVIFSSQPSPPTPASITAFSNHALTIQTDAGAPGLLVVKEAWYPGWHATVNGHEANVVPANVWMRAVHVPAGSCTVEMSYSPRIFLFGSVLSLCGLGLVISLLRSTTRSQTES